MTTLNTEFFCKQVYNKNIKEWITMDISVIDATKVTPEYGLKVGSDTAPKKTIEFINLRCPYCKKWFMESFDLLEEALAQNKVQRIIKLYDKEKPSLQRGNVMQHHLSYQDPAKALLEIKQIFDTQDEWGDLSLEEVATFAEKNLGLKEQLHPEIIEHVIEEAAAANIQFVPTIIVGEHIFDESVSPDELKSYLAI